MKLRLTLVLLAVASLLAACDRTSDHDVVVRIFRDPAAPSAALLARRIAYFQSLHVRTPNRRLIVISETVADYAGALREFDNLPAAELVILNSERDGEKNAKLQEELAHAIDIGADGHRCLAFIPSWVSGDERLAAQMLLNSLLSD